MGKGAGGRRPFPLFFSNVKHASQNNKGYERKEEKMKKAKTRIIWGIIIVIIAVILIARIVKKEEPVAPTPDPVVTAQTLSLIQI